MTREERALLSAGPARLFGWWTGIVSAVCIFALTFLVAALSAALLPFDVVVRGAFVAATVVSVASYAWIQRKERRAFRDQATCVAKETAAEHVRTTTYRVTDAVAVEEQEDEGLSYYLLLDDGRTLFLTGQYLYEPVDSGFPWESFEIVQVASGSWVLRVIPLGPPLTPSWTRAPFSDAEHSSGAIPADGTIEKRDFVALKTSAA